MKVKVFFLVLCTLCIFSFAQDNVLGVWENGGRFIEFSENNPNDTLNMKIVLKPYYTYVYEVLGNFSAKVSSVDNFAGLNILQIIYPKMKRAVYMPICLMDRFLFTSFLQRNDFESSEPNLPAEARPYGISEEQAKEALFAHASPIYGFWTEQGSRDGIMLYPNKMPEYFDAYFFNDDEYFRFRYWQDDLANIEKNARFTDSKNITFYIPRVLQRGSINYSCITANASTLRNYETGTYELKEDNNTYYITLKARTAGPGSHASKDTYERIKYPEVVNLPLYLSADGKIFSFGEPFMIRSEISDLEGEIQKHNALKKTSPEPQLVPDTLDFYDEKLRKLEKLAPKAAGAADNYK